MYLARSCSSSRASIVRVGFADDDDDPAPASSALSKVSSFPSSIARLEWRPLDGSLDDLLGALVAPSFSFLESVFCFPVEDLAFFLVDNLSAVFDVSFVLSFVDEGSVSVANFGSSSEALLGSLPIPPLVVLLATCWDVGFDSFATDFSSRLLSELLEGRLSCCSSCGTCCIGGSICCCCCCCCCRALFAFWRRRSYLLFFFVRLPVD
mmetsp:Transcript_5317/g.9446  ORF Transcript_5317/g.9446 Transcript_5317/m.9446 type:complete len:208 (+) Transcript_5317:1933-2556(+)